jgi:NADH-ubiquinone oxidoreductase chain 1
MLYTLAERKIQGSIQHRIGPNITGIYGLLQALIDGLKLFMKEILIPQRTMIIIFTLAPLLSFILSLFLWYALIFIEFSYLLILILAIGGIELYGILLGGWGSRNKYTLIGSIRTTSQLISYELLLSMIYFILSLNIGSFNISYFYILPYSNLIYLPLYLLSLLVILAETNRTPFDLPESESETVGGFLTEHSSIIFVFYFLAEYSNMLFLSYLISIIFNTNFLLLFFNLYYYIWIRASLPRLRYDHLIKLSWYHLIPLTIAYLILASSLIFALYI